MEVHAILNTHAHYDHIGAVEYLKSKYSIPFYLHSNDEKLLKSANLYIKIFDGTELIKIPEVDYYYDMIKNRIIISDFSIDVLFTPGHTIGSVCLIIEKCIFTGDTLLDGKIGRTDLPGGDEKSLKNSLKLISKLPKNFTIYSGHGRSTSIEKQLKYNKNFIEILNWA